MFRFFSRQAPTAPTTPPLRRRVRARLDFDILEDRRACSVTPLPMVFEREPGDTADVAAQMGDLSITGGAVLQGTIGNSAAGAAGAADVDWFEFTLDAATAIHLTGSDATVLSLYADTPFDFFDPAAQSGVRLMQQADGTDLDRNLSAGTYFIAVSGHGNNYFNPFLADSGLDGTTGNYQITVTATPLPSDPSAGPTVIQFDPGTNGTSSPFVIRLTMSTPIDPNSAIAGDTVNLVYNPTGNFGDGNDQTLSINLVNFSTADNELQIMPGAPLGIGYYEVVLSGNTDVDFDTIYDLNGTPLGSNAANPDGQDESFTFQITGVEGGTGAVPNDTAAGAINLGNITNAGLVQKTGAIGDDPNDPIPYDPNDVDMYHFSLTGSGTYAVTAEVFARRIGSSLDPGVSLYRVDPGTGQLDLVVGDDNTGNPIAATNGLTLPAFGDSVVFAGLTAGDYYVAVSSHGNVPDASLGLMPGQDGIFDSNVSYSGTAGKTTGPYVLNVLAQPDDAPPTVVSVTPGPSQTLSAAPTQITVQFSEDVNLQNLAFRSFEQTSQSSIPAVYIVGPDGTRYYPQLESYDSMTHTATFGLLDELAGGTFTLHLSGALGLTDFGGNPLVGNSPGGDFTTSFTVTAPIVGTTIASTEPNDVTPQNLGILFPDQLQSGVTIVRAADPSRADSSDSYTFQVLQNQSYFFLLSGVSGLALTLDDANGNAIRTSAQPGGRVAILAPGTYTVTVSGWTPATAPATAYQLRIVLTGAGENPPPLTTGAAPAIQLRLAQTTPASPTPPVVVLPPPATISPTSTGVPTADLATSSTPLAIAPFAVLAATPVGGVSSSDPAGTAIDRVILPAPTAVASTTPTAGDRGVGFVRFDGAGSSGLARLLVDGHRWLGGLWGAAVDRLFVTFGDMEVPVNFDGPIETSIEDTEPSFLPTTLPAGSLGLALGVAAIRAIDRDERRRTDRKLPRTGSCA
jgi:Bacterial Ig-like domain